MTTDSDHLIVTDLWFTPATRRQQHTGVLAFLTLHLDDRFRLEGVKLRRTRAGAPTLSFPRRDGPPGEEEFVFRPLDDASRIAFEEDVFSWLPKRLLEACR